MDWERHEGSCLTHYIITYVAPNSKKRPLSDNRNIETRETVTTEIQVLKYKHYTNPLHVCRTISSLYNQDQTQVIFEDSIMDLWET